MDKFFNNLKDNFIPALFVFIGVLIFNLILEPIISNPLFKLVILVFIIYITSVLGTILMKKINQWSEDKNNSNRKL